MAQPDVLVINLLRHEDGAAVALPSVSRLFRKHLQQSSGAGPITR